jgi:hypothetical protein
MILLRFRQRQESEPTNYINPIFRTIISTICFFRLALCRLFLLYAQLRMEKYPAGRILQLDYKFHSGFAKRMNSGGWPVAAVLTLV